MAIRGRLDPCMLVPDKTGLEPCRKRRSRSAGANPNSNHLGITWYCITVSLELFRINPGYLAERFSVKILIGLDHATQQRLRSLRLEVELLGLWRVPWSVFTKKDDAISIIEKHLRSATTVARVLPRILQSE